MTGARYWWGAFVSTVLLVCPVAARTGSHTTMYAGGTVTSIPAGAAGTSSTADKKVFTFNYRNGHLAIPYDRIDELEYGQKAGRRTRLAIAATPIALLSKQQRRHFLTISYRDASGRQEAVVFEIGKDIIRSTLSGLQARSGRKIEFQDKEARESGFGN